MRPLLRYHGGKFRMAPRIIELMPKHRCYVEPFGGGAGLLLRKPKAQAECYNDLDGSVVNVFRVLQDPESAAKLKRLVELTPFSRAEFERSYNKPRNRIDAAHKMLVRSFMGHGSDSATRNCRTGFRAKLTDDRALPSAEWATWPSEIPFFVDRLRGVVIENRAAVEIIERFDSPTTLFYLDPPYVTSSRSSLSGRSAKSHGYRHEMTDADHEDLAGVLHSIKGMAVLSGYPTDLYAALYADWQRLEFQSVADQGKARTEVVWFNDAANDQMPQRQLFASQNPPPLACGIDTPHFCL
jgi:DNA adenine methylase